MAARLDMIAGRAGALSDQQGTIHKVHMLNYVCKGNLWRMDRPKFLYVEIIYVFVVALSTGRAGAALTDHALLEFDATPGFLGEGPGLD